jgi:hypothetical protein
VDFFTLFLMHVTKSLGLLGCIQKFPFFRVILTYCPPLYPSQGSNSFQKLFLHSMFAKFLDRCVRISEKQNMNSFLHLRFSFYTVDRHGHFFLFVSLSFRMIWNDSYIDNMKKAPIKSTRYEVLSKQNRKMHVYF